MKKELRKKYKEIRKNIKNRDIASKKAANIFLELEEYKNCNSLFIFLSFGSEIETQFIIERAISDGKKVALPYMTGKPHEMVFIEINSLNDLVKNLIGIYEPIYNKDNIVVSDSSTIVVVPGLAFDSDGYRIGYGGGYYDKYLSENIYYKSVGICFEEQITESIPTDKYDVKTDIIVTDRRVIK